MCDKGFIWNPSNCECECDKSCNIGEYLDYKNHRCRKKVIDKLTVCYYHVTCAFQSESTLYSCLNVKELLARNRREV